MLDDIRTDVEIARSIGELPGAIIELFTGGANDGDR